MQVEMNDEEKRVFDEIIKIVKNKQSKLIKLKEPETWRNERVHMEGILNNRFNFLLVAVGLFVNAALQASTVTSFQILISISLFYTLFISMTLFRAQGRLNYLVDMLSKVEGDPVRETYLAMITGPKLARRSRRNIIGYIIPIVTLLILVILLLYPSLIYNTSSPTEIFHDINFF